MRNITISVEDEVYRKAREKAAARDTSVSRMVADYLRSLSKEDELRAERNRRMDELFTALDRGRKRRPIGRLKREEIYGRGLR